MSRLITEIRPVTRSKYKIYLDEEFAFVLYRSELLRYKLKENHMLPEEMYEKILQETLAERARNMMVRLLAESEKSTLQVRERLKKNGIPEEVIEETVKIGTQTGLLSDRRFAEAYYLSYKDRKSLRFIRIDLKEKGIEESVINEVLLDADAKDQVRVIQSYLLKKNDFSKALSFEEEQKLTAYAARKGFSFDDIRSAITQLQEERSI